MSLSFSPNIVPNNVKNVVVLLHGYGSNGDDLFEIARIWQKDLPNTAFYSPNAIENCMMNPFGGYQWFDLPNLDTLSLANGLNKASPILIDYLNQLLTKHKLQSDRMILVGFSQGGIISLDCLYYDLNLAGIICYSGAFCNFHKDMTKKHNTSIFMSHGMLDVVIPYTSFLTAISDLKQIGYNVTQSLRPDLGHNIDEYSMNEGVNFIKNTFKQSN